MEILQSETRNTTEPTSIPHGTTPPMVRIVSPDGDYFPFPRVPVCEQMVQIQAGQAIIHHHNMNQILYLMNTIPHLQVGHSCLQE